MFRRIDEGEYLLDIRQDVASLKASLPPDLKQRVASAIWRKRRCYLAVVVFQDPFDLTTPRPALMGLVPPATRKRVLACRLEDFQAFFDDVADAMRAAVRDFWS